MNRKGKIVYRCFIDIDLPQACHQFTTSPVTNLLQGCCQFITSLSPEAYHQFAKWIPKAYHQFTISLLPIRYKPVTNLSQAFCQFITCCHQFATSLLSICYKPVANTPQACCHFATNLTLICYKPGTVLPHVPSGKHVGQTYCSSLFLPVVTQYSNLFSVNVYKTSGQRSFNIYLHINDYLLI